MISRLLQCLIVCFRSAGAPAATVAGCIILALPALARPEYAQRESKACQYCHVSSNPGIVDAATGRPDTTDRNARGIFYGTHNHTFDGYKELTVMGAKAPPVFHFMWKEDLTDKPRRIGVGDVAGDGKARLVTLNEKTGTSGATLAVKRWDGSTFATEFTTDTQGPADVLAVGRFAGPDQPAVIVTADGLWYRKGTGYAHRGAAHPLSILGATHLKDDSERVLISESPTVVRAFRVNTSSATDWLTDGIEAPASSQVTWGDMHASADFFTKMGMPDYFGAGGVVGLWDPRKFGTIFLYYVRLSQDFDATPDPNNPKSGKPQIHYKDRVSYVGFCDPRQKQLTAEVWCTPPLSGTVYDVAVENAQASGQKGLLVLTSDSASAKGRSLYFFALD